MDGVRFGVLGVCGMNYCKQVSLNGVMAAMFGVKAMLFLAIEVVLSVVDGEAPWIYVFGHAAVLCGMVTATLVVRGFYLDAREREQKCFDTGRKVGQAESSGGRDLHSVS